MEETPRSDSAREVALGRQTSSPRANVTLPPFPHVAPSEADLPPCANKLPRPAISFLFCRPLAIVAEAEEASADTEAPHRHFDWGGFCCMCVGVCVCVARGGSRDGGVEGYALFPAAAPRLCSPTSRD